MQQNGTTLVDLIGKTPLVRLRSFERECPGVELYAKAEWQNPGGSVKDRPAARMMADGVSSGQLTRDKTLLDATSGNTGIAYGMIGAALGYRIKLCMPTNVTPERKKILRAYGAELVYTDPMDGSDGAIREARRLYAESPDEYFYPDQYNNDANWRAHYEGTGLEIIEQTDGRVTHFVAGLGTSGTFYGRESTPTRIRQGSAALNQGRYRCSRMVRCTGSRDLSTWKPRSCPVFMTRRSPMRTSELEPRSRTAWCGV